MNNFCFSPRRRTDNRYVVSALALVPTETRIDG